MRRTPKPKAIKDSKDIPKGFGTEIEKNIENINKGVKRAYEVNMRMVNKAVVLYACVKWLHQGP